MSTIRTHAEQAGAQAPAQAPKRRRFVLQLPYDKTLIAYTLGMQGATFSRALNVLRQKTGLRLKGARVEIESVKRLAQFVYGPRATKYIPGGA